MTNAPSLIKQYCWYSRISIARLLTLLSAIAVGPSVGMGQSIALEPTGMVQVTPVSELSDRPPLQGSPPLESSLTPPGLRDVLPNEWAYDALESLLLRYQIPLGFPDGTYQGDLPLTRYQLAAAMIPVLDGLRESLSAGVQPLVHKSDLVLIARLQDDFEDILAESRQRLDKLEPRIGQIEAQLFSTTTVLDGEAILALTDQGGNENATQTTGQYRVWLDFSTHFSDRDALHTRLIISDSDSFGSVRSTAPLTEFETTAEATLIQNSRGNTHDGVELDWLNYSRSLGDRASSSINLYISAKGGTHSHYVDTVSPFGNGNHGDGAMTVFGQSSPIYTMGGGAGVGGEWGFGHDDTVSLAVGYLADQASSPDAGVFNRDYTALGQLTLRPAAGLQVGLTYVHGYHSPGNALFDAGLGEAIAGTGIANATHSALDTSAITHSYGLQTQIDLSRHVSLYGFGGHTDVRFVDEGDGDIWFYGVGLGVENWLIPKSSGGLIIGTEPYLANLDHPSFRVDTDTPLHLEAFYTLRLSDQVSISPGFIWLTAPNQDHDNRDRTIATLRTTFQF